MIILLAWLGVVVWLIWCFGFTVDVALMPYSFAVDACMKCIHTEF